MRQPAQAGVGPGVVNPNVNPNGQAGTTTNYNGINNPNGIGNGQGVPAGALYNPNAPTNGALNGIGTTGNPAVNPQTGVNTGAQFNANLANQQAGGGAANTGVNNGVNGAGGVQYYNGNWWYRTPQSTWMWYNNGTWENYNGPVGH